VEQQRRVLRIGPVRVDDDRRARQRADEPQPDAGPVLVPWPRRRVCTQFSVSRKSLVHAHWGLPESITSASLPYESSRSGNASICARLPVRYETTAHAQ